MNNLNYHYMRYLLILLSTLGYNLFTFGQVTPTKTQNYIVVTVPFTAVSDINALTDANSNSTVQYFDGLGRPIQTVLKGITPAKADLVTYHEYDPFGREGRSWLPVIASGNNGAFMTLANYKTKSLATYNNTTYNAAADSVAYTYPVYEASPLNRVLEQYGPGLDWKTNKKAIHTGFLANKGKSGTAWTDADSLVCGKYVLIDSKTTVSFFRTDNYAANELYVTRTRDEDGNTGYEFKNKFGQVILTRQINAGKSFDTNYIYDKYGNLRAVLPPEASAKLLSAAATAPWPETNEDLKNYAYLYKYNDRNRCIWKKLPGCEPVYFIYDIGNRLIYTQDGENRKAGVWQFTIPDVFGRVVLTGTCKNSLDYAADWFLLDGTLVKGTYNPARTTIANSYTISGITLVSPVFLSANFYDGYEFLGMTGVPNDANTQYVAESGYGACYGDHQAANKYKSKGLLTGTLTAQMNADGTVSSTYLYSVMYYDNRGRLIQTKSNNALAGGLEKEYIAYNFTGQPTQKKHIHSATGKTTQTEVYTYTYDHAGRLLSVSHKLNSAAQVTLAQYTYDEVGRVKTKKLATETSTYNYNVRSWLTQVTGTKFNQTLAYNTAVNGVTPTKALYNGNISAMKWKAGDEATERGYKFSYDNLGRLTAAAYGEGAAITSNLNRFNENVAYNDKMGNILTLQRQGKLDGSGVYGVMDNLTYTYTGNRLTKVSDAATPSITYPDAFHFVDRANVANEYTYDTNGNVTKDLNKNITSITYNALNLPQL
jgi:hypothetical protein